MTTCSRCGYYLPLERGACSQCSRKKRLSVNVWHIAAGLMVIIWMFDILRKSA